MRCLAAFIAIAILAISISAQSGDLDADIVRVRSSVDTLAGRSNKVDFLLRDLSVLRGRIAAHPEAESFTVFLKKKKAGGVKVRYSNVLAISSKLVSISLIPDPATKPFGSWKVMSTLPVNRDIELVLQSGIVHKGRFRKVNADEMLIADAASGSDLILKRDQIASVFVVKYGARNVGGSAVGASLKGSEIGQALGSDSGQGYSGAIGASVGALVGIIKAAASKSETQKVLIYSF